MSQNSAADEDQLGRDTGLEYLLGLDGEIQVQSEQNKGTIVTIIFKKDNTKKANIRNSNVES